MPNGNAGTFGRSEYINLTKEQLMEDWGGKVGKETVRRMYEQMKRETLYKSEHYQVAIDKTPEHGLNGVIVWHLSIKRNDKEPILDWRDMQDIKNKLIGPEHEMMQLFPAESRLVDSANQYHFFALIKDSARPKARPPRFPFGWTTRLVIDDQFINGKQRARDGQATEEDQNAQ